MMKMMISAAALAMSATGLVGADVAAAHGNLSCSVPRKERRPMVELQRQLKKAGWVVRKMQVYQGCYEVYGLDERKESVEALFDPRTLDRLHES
ncbi:MAG: PepSY domain-containing protein [Pseudomonadota bacterium]